MVSFGSVVMDEGTQAATFLPVGLRPQSSRGEALGSGRHRSRVQVGSTNRPRTTPSSTRPQQSDGCGIGEQAEGPWRRYSLLPDAPGSVNPLDHLFTQLPIFTSNQDVPTNLRSEVSATWTHKVVPLPRDFKSESQAVLVPQLGKTHPSDAVFRKLQGKRRTYYKRTQEQHLETAMARLRTLAKLKYGSLRNMFSAVRLDQQKTVTLYDFSKAIRTANLEQYFPRNVQRSLFERIPGERYESADVETLINMVEPLKDVTHQEAAADDMTVDGDEQERIRKSATNDLAADVARVDLNRRLHEQCKAIKIQDDWPEDRTYLFNALQQSDSDMCGCLAPKEVATVFGHKKLHFGLDDAGLEHLLDVMSKKHPEGKVDYKLFLDFLELLRPEPNYNPVFDRREAVLQMTLDYYKEPHDLDPELAAAVFRNRQVKYEGATKVAEERREREEKLRKAEADEQVDRAKNARDMTAIRPEYLQYTVWDSLPSDIRKVKTAVGSSRALFQDINDTNQQKMAGICGRFSTPPPTDWSRVGYGGDGINPRSALHMSSSEQYTTSNSTYYPKIVYQPNKPPQRAVLSDAQREALDRKERILIKQRNHNEHLRRIRESHAVEHYDAKMKDDCRIKAKTSQALGYLSRAHQEDFFRDLKAGIMQKRGNKGAADRMFGGSNDQQFNVIRRTRKDERDFKSTYIADFVSVEATAA